MEITKCSISHNNIENINLLMEFQEWKLLKWWRERELWMALWNLSRVLGGVKFIFIIGMFLINAWRDILWRILRKNFFCIQNIFKFCSFVSLLCLLPLHVELMTLCGNFKSTALKKFSCILTAVITNCIKYMQGLKIQ